MAKTPKKRGRPPKSPKPNPTNEATVPSDEVPATSIPPKNPRFGPKIEVTQDELWEIYMGIPDENVTAKQVQEALTAKGVICSVNWVSQKLAKWDFPRKRTLALAGTAHPESFSEPKIRDYLNKLGKNFNPADTIPGMQMRFLAVISSKLATETPEYIQGMFKAYGLMTDELYRSYQYRKNQGEELPLPATKTERQENIVGFKKKGS